MRKNDMEDKTSTNDGNEVDVLLSAIEDTDTRDALAKHIETLNIQRIKNREKATDPVTGKPYKELYEAEKATKVEPKEADVSSKSGDENPEANINNKNDKMDRLELKVDFGYSDKVIDEILALGGKKFLGTELGQKAVALLIEQEKSEKAAAIDESGKSDVLKKYSAQEIAKMSAKEMEEALKNAK